MSIIRSASTSRHCSAPYLLHLSTRSICSRLTPVRCRAAAADYSFLAEHTDLRHVMGIGIAITRGSAASLSFCYSLLLLTMSRNILTLMKNYSIHQYIPIDSHIQFHKIVACTALFFTILHAVGHLVNFYHVSTQSLDNLRCLMKEMTFQSDARPGIMFWLFNTLTGE